MDLSGDELNLLTYLSQYCPTPDRGGAILVGMAWASAKGANVSHTTALANRFGKDWDRFQKAMIALSDKGLAGLHERTSVWDCWITHAGRKTISEINPAAQDGLRSGPRSSLWEQITAVVAASVGVALIVFVVYRNEPFKDPNTVVLLRGFVSLTLAVFAATVPGFLNVGWQGSRLFLRAGGALAVFALSFLFTPNVLPNIQDSPAAIPKELNFKPYRTCYHPNLPKDIFGDKSDLTARPRQWMVNAQQGASVELGTNVDGAVYFWLLTDEYPHGLAEGPVFVNIGTNGNSVVIAYLVLCNDYPTFGPLRQSQGQGPKAEYVFRVPTTHSPTRLLVFVAMSNDTYKEAFKDIEASPNYYIRNGPLDPT